METESYCTILSGGETEFEEKKSRFICYSMPVSKEEEAVSFIRSIQKKHPDATHNVWAYHLDGGNQTRYSDDGEPTGTAGMPVLETIRKKDVTNIAVVITRYFGGIQLGAGGLVRAYSHGAARAIDAGRVVRFEKYTEFQVSLSYGDYQKFLSEAPKMKILTDKVDYSESVIADCAVKKDRWEPVLKAFAEWFNGQVSPTVTGERFDYEK